MKIYADQQLSQELIETLPLGIVPAGEVRTYTFWMQNNSLAYLRNLKVIIKHDEVKVIEAPENLRANEVKKLVIEWNCSIELEQGLNVPIEIKGEKIVG